MKGKDEGREEEEEEEERKTQLFPEVDLSPAYCPRSVVHLILLKKFCLKSNVCVCV